MEGLSGVELVALIDRVFQVRETDEALAILVDLPDEHVSDDRVWKSRREMAHAWAIDLAGLARQKLGLAVHLYLYRNARHNNADLPDGAWAHRFGPLPDSSERLDPARLESFDSVFRTHSILLAPTRFSATAPLKLAARQYGFRAATMPGFTADMIPALRLDYSDINRRVMKLKQYLDPAVRAEIRFLVDDLETHDLVLDLRHRNAHASGGLFPDDGIAGNLPSGETYIVPYEGELTTDPTHSAGTLPCQFGDEVGGFRIADNVAVEVLSNGPESQREADLLTSEPAYGNMAELGLGVLSDYGLKPTGQILLDEKLGLHIAFGRSDHFGGQVGAKDFSGPAAVVHIDRVYLPQTMPRIKVVYVDLVQSDNSRTAIIRDGQYVVQW